MTERKTGAANGETNARPADDSVEAPGSGGPATEEPGAAAPTRDDLEAEIRRYRTEAEQNWQQFLHAAADLENYKKQAVRLREDAVERTRRAMLAVILTVVDNVERALEYSGQNDAAAPILDGIRLTHRRVLDVLANMGVRPFTAAGKPFDARYHEAVEVVPPTAEYPSGTVVAEVQRGYLLGDDVLRPARVRVAQPRHFEAE